MLQVESSRREVRIGDQRLEAETVRVVSVESSGNGIRISNHERVQIRSVQSSATRGLEWRGPLASLGDSSDEEDCTSSQCTYDKHGPGFMLQRWYKCRTCWGKEADVSAFGCCAHCASSCHSGHDLVRSELTKAECDCGQYKHQSAVCTWQITGRRFIRQPFYRCYDCFTIGSSDGVCYQCWKRCHGNHNTMYLGVIGAFCDCGLDCCRINCSIPKPK